MTGNLSAVRGPELTQGELRKRLLDESKGYVETLCKILAALPFNDVAEVAEIIASALKNGATVFVAGNGGSSAWASHFVTDISKVLFSAKTSGAIYGLTDNSAQLTAFANDYGYENCLALLLSQRARSGDVLVVASASGNSQNLINVVSEARKIGVVAAALLGFDGGALLSMADHACLMRTDVGAYGPAEDVQLACCHILARQVHTLLLADGGPAAQES